jgi:hypothetical protein
VPIVITVVMLKLTTHDSFKLGKEQKCRFKISGYLLRLYNSIQSDYNIYRITSVYRREIFRSAFRVAGAANTEVADSGATVVGTG